MHTLDQRMARFYGGSYVDQRRIHYVTWSTICRPIEKGGLGLRLIADTVTAFSYRL